MNGYDFILQAVKFKNHMLTEIDNPVREKEVGGLRRFAEDQFFFGGFLLI
jgi:hypothetical protein